MQAFLAVTGSIIFLAWICGAFSKKTKKDTENQPKHIGMHDQQIELAKQRIKNQEAKLVSPDGIIYFKPQKNSLFADEDPSSWDFSNWDLCNTHRTCQSD